MQQINGVLNEQQRVPEWYAARMGRFSCSQFFRLMTEPKLKADKEAGNLSDGAMTYVYECIAEKLTGQSAKDDFTSKYTQWGIDNEPIAKEIYNNVFDCKVANSDYIAGKYNCGGSPDGLVNEDGLIEIKCPYTITSHLEHKLKEIPVNYYWQCLGYIYITKRQWIDFVSYHPAYPGKLQLVRKRLTFAECELDIQRLEAKLIQAEKVLTQIITPLN